jgi:hypothetical protein
LREYIELTHNINNIDATITNFKGKNMPQSKWLEINNIDDGESMRKHQRVMKEEQRAL